MVRALCCTIAMSALVSCSFRPLIADKQESSSTSESDVLTDASLEANRFDVHLDERSDVEEGLDGVSSQADDHQCQAPVDDDPCIEISKVEFLEVEAVDSEISILETSETGVVAVYEMTDPYDVVDLDAVADDNVVEVELEDRGDDDTLVDSLDAEDSPIEVVITFEDREQHIGDLSQVVEFVDSGDFDEAVEDHPSQPSSTEIPQEIEATEDVVVEEKLRVQIETEHGVIAIRLFPEIAPRHVARFVEQVEQGAWKNWRFHHALPTRFLRFGSKASGVEQKNATVNVEFEAGLSIRRGVLGALRLPTIRNPSRSSQVDQFYICLEDREDLDGQFVAFGQIESGWDYLSKIKSGPERLNGAVLPWEAADRLVDAQVLNSKEIEK